MSDDLVVWLRVIIALIVNINNMKHEYQIHTYFFGSFVLLVCYV